MQLWQLCCAIDYLFFLSDFLSIAERPQAPEYLYSIEYAFLFPSGRER